MPGVNWAAKLINAGSQIDVRGGGLARTHVLYVRDDLWPRAFYHSTATVQTTHTRLFVAVSALARHGARCLPPNTSLINLTLVMIRWGWLRLVPIILCICYYTSRSAVPGL